MILPRATFAMALFAFSCVAVAQTSVKGSVGGSFPDGGSYFATFSCLGAPTCSGVYNGNDKLVECPNTYVHTDALVITGLDLTRSGPISGTVQLTGVDVHANQGSNTSVPCNFTNGGGTKTVSYTGSWNAATGTGTLTVSGTDDSNRPFQLPGTFSAIVASAPPVFPMTVTGSITPTVTDIQAQVQPRPQDTGTNASIYVFAHAPSNLVSGITPTKRGAPPIEAKVGDGAIVCVLAQVDANGHLTAVSASTMRAYLTGVLSSQSQSVSILNNVPTPNVAGASMFVGYGSSARSMLANGVYQSAVNLPGGVQCTASLASAPAAATPAALSGLWWNAAESGWGIHFTQRGVNLFAAWYTYDAQGNPKWYVAPNCAFSSGNAASGNCTSALYEVAGTAFFGHDFNPAMVHASQAGSLQLSFQNSNGASMTYSIGSQTRTVAIVRQIFPVASTPPPAVDFTDLWWNPNESGWGMAIAHQFGNVFVAWYVYDATGKPFWYVAPSCTVSGSSCSGTLYRTTGPAFGPPLDPAKVQAFPVGSAIVSFIDANNAVLSYAVDGVSASKAITRQIF